MAKTAYHQTGIFISEFVLGQALHAADEVIHEHETLTLNEADWEVFLDALDNPPKPIKNLSRPLPNTRNASSGKGQTNWNSSLLR